MGDSDESVFCWDEKEEEDYGFAADADADAGVYASQHFQINHSFESADQSLYDEDSGSKRIRLSSDSDNQEGDEDSSSYSSPLGLKLSKTPSFLNLLQKSLSKAKQQQQQQQQQQADHFSTSDGHDKSTRKVDDLSSQSNSEKLKASNFPAFQIQIGSWQRVTRHEGDLTAKLYYAKRKLVWEVLDGGLKSKIEIQWSDISGLRAIMLDNVPGILEIELNQPPLFYREINPQPRKHTLWQQSSDFTGGQAPTVRRHYVRFPPGVLDRHYEKLLQCDERLLALSQRPFPSYESPYFDNMFGISQLSVILNNYGSNYQTPVQAYPRGLSSLAQLPNSAIPTMDFPSASNGASSWAQPHYQPNVGLINDLQQHFLGGSSHAGSSNEAISSLLNPTNAHQYYSTDQVSQLDIATDFNPIAQSNYWPMPPQEYYSNNDGSALLMGQQMNNNNSLPPFFLPGKNPNTGSYY